METTTIKAEFTKWVIGENWVGGNVGKYRFQSKLFDEGSTFGIENGRVSKLAIWDEQVRQEKKNFFAGCLVNYDRGWDKEPTEEFKPYYHAVMELLENAPKDRFENEETD